MTQKNDGKFDKKNYIFSIVLLSIFLCVSLVYNFLGGFNPHAEQKYVSYIGQDTVIKMSQIGSSVSTLAIDGTSLPGDNIMQKVDIVLPNVSTQGMTLRARAMLAGYEVYLSGYTEWEKREDNYYYFTGEIYQNQNIGLCNSITLPDANLDRNTVYFVEFMVEYFYTEGLLL